MSDVIDLLSDKDTASLSENNSECDIIDLSQNSDSDSEIIVASKTKIEKKYDFEDENFDINDLPTFSCSGNNTRRENIQYQCKSATIVDSNKAPEMITNYENIGLSQNITSILIEGNVDNVLNLPNSTRNTENKSNQHMQSNIYQSDDLGDIVQKYLNPKRQLEKEMNCTQEILGKKQKGNSELMKLAAREQKQKERADKKAQAAKEKEMKRAFNIANKSKKPEECMKYVTCVFDTNLSSEFGPDIFECINSTEATLLVEPQIIPNTITWKRGSINPIINEDGEITNVSNYEIVSECALVISWKELINLIHEKKFMDHMTSLQAILCDKKIFLITVGLEKYFRYHKNQKNYEINKEKTKKNNATDKLFAKEPKISRKQLEYALTELQLLCNCNYRNTENSNEIGVIIMQMTKSIAQVPFKLDKKKQFQDAEWYISGDNKDTVRVDQKGNGLKRLWQQQLTIFPLARLETADAIIMKYSTPAQLIKALSECSYGVEKEQLLQDIPIRRAAGPLTAVRKIGPELSKKVATFFTSIDGDAVI